MIDATKLTRSRRRAAMPNVTEFIVGILTEFPNSQVHATDGEYEWRFNMPDALEIARRNER